MSPSVGSGMGGNVTSSSVLSSTYAAVCSRGFSSFCDARGERSGLGGGETSRFGLGVGEFTGVGCGVGTGLCRVV